MGIKRMGPPHELIKKLQHEFKIINFVESGTYQGNTTLWANSIFQKVWTIENSEAIFSDLKRKLIPNFPNIKFLFGDTRICLTEIKKEVSGATLFWLDAHWCGGMTFGTEDPCPLLEELDILSDWPGEKFIIIDDARLFLSPPPTPHEREKWPTIDIVLEKLKTIDKTSYIVIQEDVIISVPQSATFSVASYCIEVTDDDVKQLERQNKYKGRLKGIIMIVNGISMFLIKKSLF